MSKFASPFMAKSPLKQNEKDELKNVSELPGYQPIVGSSVNAPIGGKAGLKLAAKLYGAATVAAAPVVVNMPKIMDKKDELVENVSTFVTDKVIPKVQKVKAKVGGKIRRAVGMDKHIYPGSSGA